MLTFALVAVLLIMEIAAVPHPDTAGHANEHKLQIISLSKERLEANFYTTTGGIRILSQIHSNGDLARVSITSMNGETIFAVDYPTDRSQGLLTINGDEFFIANKTLSNGENQVKAYYVPDDFSLQVKTEMKLTISKSLMDQLDGENVNATARTAIEHLLIRTEVQVIPIAAIALGNAGVYGRDNPAAMAFYTTALRFAKVISQDTFDDTIPPPTEAAKPNRYRRWVSYCSNSGSYCWSNNCPSGSNCVGMCGPGCTCWWFVCDDCCQNIGCYLHDVYGCPDGTDTWQCWLTAPIGLVCTPGPLK